MANLLSILSGAEVPEENSGEQSHAEKWGRIGKVTYRGGLFSDHRPQHNDRHFKQGIGQLFRTRGYEFISCLNCLLPRFSFMFQ